MDEALEYRTAFRAAAADVPEDRHVHMVPSSLTLAVATKMLDGEITYRQAALLSQADDTTAYFSLNDRISTTCSPTTGVF